MATISKGSQMDRAGNNFGIRIGIEVNSISNLNS